MKLDCLLIILFVFSLSACVDDEGTMPPGNSSEQLAAPDFVSGINYYDANAQPIGAWRTPNEKTDSVTAYPNPFIDVFQLFSVDAVTKVWVIEASCDPAVSTDNVESILADLSYTDSDLESGSLNVVIETEGDLAQAAFNTETLSEGFYRIFYKRENGTIGWQNAFKFQGTEPVVPEDYLDGFCQ